jgi:polar amino acid transport system substrate-binding protein
MPFAKADTPLRDAVKAAIERLQASGAYDKMLAKYGLADNKLTPISINKGE